jgi:predicted RNase H-like nuclease (RuvC/YqgF family)
MDIEELKATNRRLNYRCQKAEHEAASYKAKYEGKTRALDHQIRWLIHVTQQTRRTLSELNHERQRYCFVCNFVKWLKGEN